MKFVNYLSGEVIFREKYFVPVLPQTDLVVEVVKSTHFIAFMEKNIHEIVSSRQGIGNGKSAQSKASDNTHNIPQHASVLLITTSQ